MYAPAWPPGSQPAPALSRHPPGWDGRDELLGDPDAKAIGQNGAERLDLHLAEAGERVQVRLQVGRCAGIGPDARRVAS